MTTNTELAKYAAGTLVRPEGTLTKTAGKSMAVAGGTGLGLYVLAGVLPFITLPWLLVILVLGGGFLYLK